MQAFGVILIRSYFSFLRFRAQAFLGPLPIAMIFCAKRFLTSCKSIDILDSVTHRMPPKFL